MSSEPIEALDAEREEEIVRALVLLHQISAVTIERVKDLMRSAHIGFAEAAIRSGEIAQRQLDEALDYWNRQRAQTHGDGLIAEVLRRTSKRREVVLWQRDELEPDRRLVLAHEGDHPHSEQVRSLRTQLLLRTKEQHRAKTIAVLSTAPREGRSHLAAELALSFAQLGRSTLLVDCDFRHPKQHELFGAKNEVGLAQALLDGPAQYELHGIRGLPDMALLASGILPPNPLELLSGRSFERAVSQWRRNFEFIVLDTPPAMSFSDGLLVATVAKTVLLVGRRNLTRFADLGDLCNKLAATGSQILGAVINRF